MTTAASALTAGPIGHVEALPEAQDDKAFGFWLYLLSDAIIFSLLFATYVIMAPNVAGGPTAKGLFSLSRAFEETALLLLSSVTFGFAAVAAISGRRRAVLFWLLVTAALGLAFVVMEISEFRDLVQAGAGPDRSGFLSAFFTLVGTHGLHVSIGLLWILVMMSQIIVKGLSAPVMSRLVRLGLFWHFLDIVWIGIFSVVYLPGIM